MKYLAIILLALVVVGCQATEAPEPVIIEEPEEVIQLVTCPDGSEVSEESLCPEEVVEEVVVEEPEPEPESYRDQYEGVFTSDEQATASVAAELTEMRERAEEKTANGYKYTYQHSKDGFQVDSPYLGARIVRRDDLFTIDFQDEIQFEGIFVTHLSGDTQELEAFCVMCEVESLNDTFETPDLADPLEYLSELQSATYVGEQTINKRNAYELSGVYAGEDVTVFIDTFSGVPLRIETDNELIEFRDISLGARDSEFFLE